MQEGCEQMIQDFFDGGGQVVIYDANNGTRERRQRIAEIFDKKGVHVVFLGGLIPVHDSFAGVHMCTWMCRVIM